MGLSLEHRPENLGQRIVSSFNFVKPRVVLQQLARGIAQVTWHAWRIARASEVFKKTHCFQERAGALVWECHFVCNMCFASEVNAARACSLVGFLRDQRVVLFSFKRHAPMVRSGAEFVH